jgi:restriction endonuclease
VRWEERAVDWKEYEQEIETYFRAEYPSARITANAKIPGKFSRIDRQIDLLIEEQACDFEFRIVIDAKYRNRKADVKDVEEFLGLARDVGAHKAVMISTEGYTEAAVQRAHADDADVILDVLNFKELEQFHGFCAIPYAGPHGVVLQAPFGWVVDATQGRSALAWLYEQGLTFEDALNTHEFMYVNFWGKKEPAWDLASLFKYQESYIRKGSPAAQIDFVEAAHRTDATTAIRILRLQRHPGIAEYTGFVDFNGFIFMCVLFTPDKLVEKNLSKLRFVMRKVLPMTVIHDKTEVGQAAP